MSEWVFFVLYRGYGYTTLGLVLLLDDWKDIYSVSSHDHDA